MAYNNVISRTDAAALIPEVVSNAMLEGIEGESAAMQIFRRVPVSTNVTRMPVVAALPVAEFINGDTGIKPTTEVNWANKYLNVEEIAAIVPIPEAVLDDATFDVWGAVRPLLENAIGRTLDAAIFFGTNKPASWPTDITTAATAAGNVAVIGTNTQAQGGIAEDINDLMGTVESDGYDVNAFVADRGTRAVLRGARDTTGQRLLDINGAVDSVEGIRIVYAMPGLWPTAVSTARMFAGDATKSILGVRQDVTYKILDQAVIQDGAGVIQFNLAQQDMVAMRVVFRVAWQMANPITYSQATEANRYPWAVLKAAAA